VDLLQLTRDDFNKVRDLFPELAYELTKSDNLLGGIHKANADTLSISSAVDSGSKHGNDHQRTDELELQNLNEGLALLRGDVVFLKRGSSGKCLKRYLHSHQCIL